MKYKVGDKVKIKSLDWYNENKDKNGIVNLIPSSKGTFNFIKPMARLCGKVVTIMRVGSNFYDILEDSDYCWTDEMIEGLVEDETSIKLTGKAIKIDEMVVGVGEWNLPKGYIFKDENGNIINATKIVLEKIKKEYPKTYKECLAILNYNIGRVSGYKASLLAKLQDLLVCRDAYWKIAGEEMGLGKSWEPDWNDLNRKYFISLTCDGISLYNDFRNPQILAFPTEEMRDAFYENFKNEIEQCKELL